MLYSPAARLLRPSLLLARALSCCAAEAAAQPVPAQPGSVSEYHQHVLLQLPRPNAAVSGGSGSTDGGGSTWWPPMIEKEPTVVAAFAAVARHEDMIGGTIKITAFDDVPSRSGGQPASHGPPPGSCNLVAFPAGLRWEGLAVEQVGLAVALATAINPQQLPLTPAERKALNDRQVPVPDLSLFVCCHAARDARCGAAGPPLAAALQRLVRERGLPQHVRVYQTSHVGGHKYAGNVVVYGAMHPCDGDVFGGVSAAGAAAFLDALMGVELGVDGGAGDPVLRPFWRGRMGLSKLEQRDLFESGGEIEELLDVVSEDESYTEADHTDAGETRARRNGAPHHQQRQRGRNGSSTPSMAEELREGVTSYEE